MKKKAGKVLFLASLWSFSLHKILTLEMVKSGRYRAMKMVLEGQNHLFKQAWPAWNATSKGGGRQLVTGFLAFDIVGTRPLAPTA